MDGISSIDILDIEITALYWRSCVKNLKFIA